MRIVVSAGEASGRAMVDQFKLEMARLEPTCEVISLQDTVELAPVFGFWEGLRVGPRLHGVLSRAEASVMRLEPDVAVLVSFSGLHLPLGRRLRRRGIPVLYLGPPQVWAWGGWRKRRLRKAADKVVCLFRFEEELLHRAGVDAVYLGYPLLDSVTATLSRAQTLEKLGLGPNERYVVFLPGSRPSEIAYHQPLFVEVLTRLRRTGRGMRGVVVSVEVGPKSKVQSPKSDGIRRKDEGGRMKEEDGSWKAKGEGRKAHCPTGAAEAKGGDGEFVTVTRDRYDVMRHADCACAVSGTVTAELAILGVPMVVCYHLPWLSRVLAQALVRTPHFALPNILAGTWLVPEKLEPEPEWLARKLELLMRDSEERRQQLEGLARVAANLGPPGAMARICRLVTGMNGRRRKWKGEMAK